MEGLRDAPTAERYVRDGMIAEVNNVERLTKIQGRPPHTYRTFATDMANSA